MNGRPTDRRWRTRSQTSDPTLWWSGTIPPGRVSNCDKVDTGKVMKYVTHTPLSTTFPLVGVKLWRSQRWSLPFATPATFYCPRFSSLSCILLFRFFQVGSPPKRLLGLDSTLIHQINHHNLIGICLEWTEHILKKTMKPWNYSPGNTLPFSTKCVQNPFSNLVLNL